MKRWFPSWMLLLGLVACAPAVTPTPLPPTPSLWEGVTSISEILSDPEGYEGREVVVVAYYRGWDLFGEAGTGPPLTRSDVAVADGTGGIYIVSGEGFEGFRGAPSLPPDRPSVTETLLRIRGVVRVTPSGQPYIEVMEGEKVEGLPMGVVLRVHRQGTLLGLSEELLVWEDGTVYFLDRKASYRSRFSVDPGEVAQVLDMVGAYLSDREVGTPIPDTAVYDFTVWEGDAVHTLRVFEWESPLSEAVGIVAQWCDQGRAKREQPDIRGVVTDISAGQGDVLGTVRIEGSITEGTEYDKAVVAVTEETEVVRRGPGGEEKATFDDVQVGQRVEATFVGPVAESYPVQATAGRIVILEE
jgi:hypothetical protein